MLKVFMVVLAIHSGGAVEQYEKGYETFGECAAELEAVAAQVSEFPGLKSWNVSCHLVKRSDRGV